jgi:hypothetical protein
MPSFMDHGGLVIDFIRLYRECPELWDPRCPAYCNRQMKVNAQQMLADLLKVIYPNADRKLVTKKINVLRTRYRRFGNW